MPGIWVDPFGEVFVCHVERHRVGVRIDDHAVGLVVGDDRQPTIAPGVVGEMLGTSVTEESQRRRQRVKELVRTAGLAGMMRRDEQVDVCDGDLMVIEDVIPGLVVRVDTKYDAVVTGAVENHVRATVVLSS